MPPVNVDPAKVKTFENAIAFYRWLSVHHHEEDEVWIRIYKVGSGLKSITPKEAIDVCLCWGWIDAVRKRFDDKSYLQRYTRRRKRSIWSAVNVAKVAELRAAGRMRPAGEAAFAARRDDRTAIYSFEQAVDPELEPAETARFRANEAAWRWFSAKSPSFRKQALYWVISAKKPETRERRLATLIQDSAAGRPIRSMVPTRRSSP